VIVTEEVVKRALAPLSAQGRAHGISVTCELTAGVGRLVLGCEKAITDALVRTVGHAMARPGAEEITVRLARRFSGMAGTDVVMVTVTRRGSSAEPTELELELPLLSAAEAEETVDAAPSGAADPDAPRVIGARFLVISPLAQSARIVATGAREIGATAMTATDVPTALERLHAATADGVRFDLVYVDDRSDETCDVLRALAAQPLLGRVPRLVATSRPAGPETELLRRAGANAVLAQPVLPRELGAAVAQLLLVEAATLAPSLAPPALSADPVDVPLMADVLDLTGLASRTGGDAALMAQLFRDFLRHGRKWSNDLRDAAEARAFEDMSRMASRLRSALFALGARVAGAAMADVEAHAFAIARGATASDTWVLLARALHDMTQSLTEVRDAMKAFVVSVDIGAPVEGLPRFSSLGSVIRAAIPATGTTGD